MRKSNIDKNSLTDKENIEHLKIFHVIVHFFKEKLSIFALESKTFFRETVVIKMQAIHCRKNKLLIDVLEVSPSWGFVEGFQFRRQAQILMFC